jgi:hypothetical protein
MVVRSRVSHHNAALLATPQMHMYEWALAVELGMVRARQHQQDVLDQGNKLKWQQ